MARTSKIPFAKMSGSGNDFILIDNRKEIVPRRKMRAFVKSVCRRGLSVGADGVIFIQPSRRADFRWHYFNSDGGEAEMCGNGSRCAARFATLKKIAPKQMTFETLAGIIHADVGAKGVTVTLPLPHDLRLNVTVEVGGKSYDAHFLNTGVPHTVLFLDDVEDVDVQGLGRAIRFHPLFAPTGTNANFVRIDGPRHLTIRTYERGVEAETLACGTGSVAAAVLAGLLGKVSPPVTLTTRGGPPLIVGFELEGHAIRRVELTGEARLVYEGTLSPEALL
ncbi:MAG TPA: diaminopimelate epimerase [Nitrospiria bacterium]|nr:diaminopimelate epimerase [Nitrospiria bacterium]